MEQRWNERAGETGDPWGNPPTSGFIRHKSHERKSGVTQPGIEPGSPWWEASRLTAQPPQPIQCGLLRYVLQRHAAGEILSLEFSEATLEEIRIVHEPSVMGKEAFLFKARIVAVLSPTREERRDSLTTAVNHPWASQKKGGYKAASISSQGWGGLRYRSPNRSSTADTNVKYSSQCLSGSDCSLLNTGPLSTATR
ncbi:hypothetical protein PR048_013723 [Dryococelus australis]|uniref:Uncharacterized protein n=1 Tax=Dryococelus australis TaxID=614101 RepID=A0ABQ9HSZ4_9NEOP|nr:hypothetical protein PR048_013723 [Dryococelus australis]